MTKAMQADGLGWSEDCRPLARQALVGIVEDSLVASIDVRLLARACERLVRLAKRHGIKLRQSTSVSASSR